MKKTMALFLLLLLLMTGCFAQKKPAMTDDSMMDHAYESKEEAVEILRSLDYYFDDFSRYALDYKTDQKDATLQDYMDFAIQQMEEFSEDEKNAIDALLAEINADAEKAGITLPALDRITFVKTTQLEECGSLAYTHGTMIFFGDNFLDQIESNHDYAKEIMWHEIFHCLTRNNPEFRKDMYSIIHFTVNDTDYGVPEVLKDSYIPNPDVEHHDAYASFNINGEMKDCYLVFYATKPYEKKGDVFFDCMGIALVPIDGSNTFYPSDQCSNMNDVMGSNTGYLIDPEECMADNFRFAMTYGRDGKEYQSPEIIDAILSYLEKK